MEEVHRMRPWESFESTNAVLYREVQRKRHEAVQASQKLLPWWMRHAWEEVVLLAAAQLAALAWVGGLLG